MEKIQQPDSPSSKSNNSNCSAKNNESPSLPNTNKPSYGRYCHIVKRPDFDGYGFNLHSEKIKSGQYIGKVDPDSPAEAAGLREGDQIIEVNGVNIGDEAHKQVVQRIKAISNEVRLLLIDPNTESIATNSKSQTATIGDAAEKNTNKTTNSIPTQPNSSTTTTITTPTTVSMIVEATVVPSENQIDEVTNISMVSRKTQSTYSNDPTVDDTYFNTNETTNNGHHSTATAKRTTTTIANGKSSEISTSKVQSEVTQPPTITTTPPPPSEQQMMDSSNDKSLMMSQTDNNVQSQNKAGLNLNLTAAEMRAKLSAKKKFDPKNDSVDLKKKFDIIQKL